MTLEDGRHVEKWYFNQMPIISLVEPGEAGYGLRGEKNYIINEESCDGISEAAGAVIGLELTDGPKLALLWSTACLGPCRFGRRRGARKSTATLEGRL